MDLEKVRKHHQDKEAEIKQALSDFEKLRDSDNSRLFKELVFVILTSQTDAERSWKATEELEKANLLEKGSKQDIAKILEKNGIQYEKNKAAYIIENREMLSQPTLKEPGKGLKIQNKIDSENLEKTRKWFAENIRGLSWKGASHFLRNIGYGNSFAIISGRISSKMFELDYLKDPKQPSGKQEYLKAEKQMQKLSKDLEIEIKELDLVLWSMETGKIFK